MDSPQVSPEDLSISLYEISIRVPDSTLQSLSRTPLWSAIASASQDQNWWFRRTEYLVGQSLTPRTGDWKRVYTSLSREGFEFDEEQDYGSLLLVQVLLEIGADPSMVLTKMVPTPSRAYSSPKTRRTYHDTLEYAVRDGNVEVIALLLQDPRVREQRIYNHWRILRYAMDSNREDIVRLLLTDHRFAEVMKISR